tara:strand:+ start:4121 stop:4765 length:645 start_codon:yes stop_codon:yes gene_type:complete
MKIKKYNLFITSDINSIGKSLSISNYSLYVILSFVIILFSFALFGFYELFKNDNNEKKMVMKYEQINEQNDSIYFYQDPVKANLKFDSPVITNLFKKGHKGLDVTGPIGTKIYSVLPGIVLFEGNDKKMGNFIIINHENGLQSKYMHNKKNYVKVGETIELKEPIAEMGKTGTILSKKEGIHLHFELCKDGISINPNEFIKDLDIIDTVLGKNN